jgi:hypothetical protein
LNNLHVEGGSSRAERLLIVFQMTIITFNRGASLILTLCIGGHVSATLLIAGKILSFVLLVGGIIFRGRVSCHGRSSSCVTT